MLLNGQTGVGKSFLAQAIGVRACQHGKMAQCRSRDVAISLAVGLAIRAIAR